MPCFSNVFWLRRLGKSAPKDGSCGGSAAEDVAKLCTTLWRESISEVKIVLKTGGVGALFEVQTSKTCTTLWRESDSEVKTVKNWRCRSAF